MGRFLGSTSESIEQTRLPRERREEIVRLAALAADAHLTDPTTVHAIRFDRAKANSLAATWDQASHLITTFAKIQSQPGNFNFVFSDEEARASQGDHLHGTVPYVMYHALRVVSALIGSLGTQRWSDDLRQGLR